MLKLDLIFHFFSNYGLESMKFRQFMEFVSSSLLQLQWMLLINTPFSIVILKLRSAASIGMDMLLVTIFFA